MSVVEGRKAGPAVRHLLKEISAFGITVPSAEEVQVYLGAHPDLARVLLRLCSEARSSLPSDVQLSLELYRDRESDDAYLTLYARQAVYSPDLLDRIEAASERFDELLRDRFGWLLLTTDYHRPS